MFNFQSHDMITIPIWYWTDHRKKPVALSYGESTWDTLEDAMVALAAHCFLLMTNHHKSQHVAHDPETDEYTIRFGDKSWTGKRNQSAELAQWMRDNMIINIKHRMQGLT